MINKKESFYKSVFYLLLSQMFIKIVGLAYKIYLTNKEGFGDSGNAVYGSGFQIYALLLTFSSTGVPNAISKLVAERLAVGDNKGAYNIFKISVITFALLGILGSIVLFFTARNLAKYWIQIPEAENSLICLAPSIFFVSIIAVFRGYFNGRQSFSVTAKSQSIEQVFKTNLTVIFVETVTYMLRTNISIMAGAANLATTVATIISFIYVFLYYRKTKGQIGQEIKQSINYKPVRIRKTLKTILSVAIPISISSLIASFNKNIDSFTVVRFLKTITSEYEAKVQYGILSGKIDSLCTVAFSLNIPFVTVFTPEIARTMAKGDRKKTDKKIKQFICISFFIALPITLIMAFFSDWILKIIFPNASSGAIFLKISSIQIIFMIIGQTVNSILQALGKVNIPPISFGIGMIFKFLCNIILIPNSRFGIFGAIIGNIICNVVVCTISLITLFVMRKNAKYVNYIRRRWSYFKVKI